MSRVIKLLGLVWCFSVVWAGVSLEDVAREYNLHVRYNWTLGYGEIFAPHTNRFCRVFFTMPYVVLDGQIHYFESGPVWEESGRIVLPPDMLGVVQAFARDVSTQRNVGALPRERPLWGVPIPPQNISNHTNVPVARTAAQPTNRAQTNAVTTNRPPPPPQRPATNTNMTNQERERRDQVPTNRQPSPATQVVTRDLFQPIRTIIIDPGHGGRDPGGVGHGGIREKDLVMTVSRILQRKFEARGYRVVLTRQSDVHVSLGERVRRAYEKWNNNDGAIFLSIHGNMSLNRRVSGIEIYYFSDRASDAAASAVEMRENASFGMEDVERTQDFYSILNVLMQEGSSRVSRILAEDIKSSMAPSFSRVSVRSANFYVLRFSPLPAILWEMGYLSNREEAALLKSAEHQNRLSEAFVRGVDRFIRRYNERRGDI